MTVDEPVRLEHRGDLTRAVLLRPALDAAVVAGLTEAVRTAERRPECRMLALSAAGPEFCAGMEISAGGMPGWMDAVPNALWSLLERLSTTRILTVALVDGAADGGGTGLAAACDMVLAGPGARFRLPEVALGLIPAVIFPFVARRVGAARCYRLALTAAALGPAAAAAAGLADVVTADIEPGLRRLRREMRRGDPGALTDLKRYYNTLCPIRGDAGAAVAALRVRFAAPSTRARLEVLRLEGPLP
jgi:polyketide biosynthesis enoyl-CoA hydratase PksH